MTNFKNGEQRAAYLLRQSGYTIEDVSNNSNYFSKDIDLLATRDGETFSIEVKWDKLLYSTGNIFYELISNEETMAPGWTQFTESDYVFYGDAVNGIFYAFNTKALKEYVNEHQAEYAVGRAPDYGANGVKKYSIGLLIPIHKILYAGFCRKFGG